MRKLLAQALHNNGPPEIPKENFKQKMKEDSRKGRKLKRLKTQRILNDHSNQLSLTYVAD